MQGSCELGILSISPLHKSRLYNAGYQTSSDLEKVDASQISRGKMYKKSTIVNSVKCPWGIAFYRKGERGSGGGG